MTLKTLLLVGGVLHFCILIASALTPIVLDWRRALGTLNEFLRKLVWVYGAFIALTITGFGALTVLNAETLAAGSPLARTLCGFIAFFWLCRLLVQLFIFDIKPVVSSRILMAGYHGLTLTFIYFVGVYGAAALGLM